MGNTSVGCMVGRSDDHAMDGDMPDTEANHDVSLRPSGANPALTRRAGSPRDSETPGRRGAGPTAGAPRGGVSAGRRERAAGATDSRKFLRKLAQNAKRRGSSSSASCVNLRHESFRTRLLH